VDAWIIREIQYILYFEMLYIFLSYYVAIKSFHA
jgi:hypothetical protein